MRFFLGLALVACGSDGEPVALTSPVGEVPAYEQRAGDATAGYRALVHEGYVGCGIPLATYKRVFPDPAPAAVRLPDRTGANADLPFNLSAFTTTSGVEVVAPNCLQCHAQQLDGQVIVGLGSHVADYTQDFAGAAQLACALVEGEPAKTECNKFRDRLATIAPYIVTETAGVNPADNIAAVLFAHRDPETLAWSETPRMEYPPRIVVPVDVPPWWHMQKKHAMFYVGAGRGDHARIMMTASTLCVDSVEEARAIDSYFPDVRSYLLSIKPPAWPFAIDSAKAAAGRGVFEEHCAKCHGTYGDAAAYPNLIVSVDEVGTDGILALGAGQFANRYINWYNDSFFGELSFLAPAPGYIAPPLDGIWASAPYLHNASVPTLAALLESATRPKFFIKTSEYDPPAVGWKVRVLPAGQDTSQDGVKETDIYDTTLLGYGNGGHTFGDVLTADDRAALLEYLKTL